MRRRPDRGPQTTPEVAADLAGIAGHGRRPTMSDDLVALEWELAKKR
ncbi:hypothetical protein [Streptomyces sp. NBC_00986]|nr:hypothetical protein OG504_51105 [Streptomyces sp. NBC_00986]